MPRTLQASDLIPLEISDRSIKQDGDWITTELYEPPPDFIRGAIEGEEVVVALIRCGDIGCAFEAGSLESAYEQAQDVSAELGLPVEYQVAKYRIDGLEPLEITRVVPPTEWQTVNP
jgi:hypothetical protein